jgi:hypothetical protein
MFRPEPWQVPTQDGVQRPVSVQTSVQLPVDATQTSRSALIQLAQHIVSRSAPQLQHWLNGLRQQISMSGNTYSSRQLRMPGMAVQWSFNSGQERLIIKVNPSLPEAASAGGYELNFDGYIAFVSNNINVGYAGPDQGVTYDFSINGKTFYTYFQPRLVNECIVFRFGSTALRCQSLADTDQKGPGNPNQDTLGLTFDILPPRAKTKAFTAVAGDEEILTTTTVPSHADLPLYPIYDWNSDLENNMTPPKPLFPSPLQFTKVVDFTGSANPIVNQGMNKFRVASKPNMLFNSAWYWTYHMIAEFYSRNVLRPAQIGWTQIAPEGGTLIVNDKPLYWQMTSQNQPNMGMDIDLTPVFLDTTQPTQFSGFSGDGSGGGKGYWRPGDRPTLEVTAPSFPWGFASEAAETALAFWSNVDTMYEETFGPVANPASGNPTSIMYYNQVNSALATFTQNRTTTDATANATDVFDLPNGQGALASISSSLALCNTLMAALQWVENVVFTDAQENNDFGPGSPWAALQPLYTGALSFLSVQFPSYRTQCQATLTAMANYSLQ